ncbi:MAG: glycosyl transferase, family 2 [Bacteroidetes bacterium]|jgi:glycosyltransferase involved in cell wall biosynthesis|nr:glycosyl transferase, family 2 [Bacteroidota bacterium]
MKAPAISIIIPCYNAALYLEETVRSVFEQHCDTEIILVDDGSTDNTEELLKKINNSTVNYFRQENTGVSAARNKGLELAKGEYLVFFDSDDLMSPRFLLTRMQELEQNKEIGFVCGDVEKFSEQGMKSGSFKGPDPGKIEEQILLYTKEVITCPSNFMFKREFLTENKLRFNERLSSTADRFFLLQCNKAGSFQKAGTPLYYRVSPGSMSNRLDKSLVEDNERYYDELKKAGLIPERIKNNSLFLGDFILSGSYWKTGNKWKALKYGSRCFFRDPIGMIRKLNR